jgi:predicted RNA-binding Zn-ribbon protein involved in translation (DUF1610 family)
MSEVTSERSRLITIGIALFVLAIFAGIAHRLPEASRVVTGYLSVGDIIRLVILFIMLSVVLSARPPLARLSTYYAHSGFKTRERPERMEVGTHVTGLATEIVNVIVIAILWPIVAGIVNALLLMDVERSFDWVPIVVTIAFVAILLWRLYLAYQSLRPVLDATSGGKVKTSCPECGTLNTATAKFCSSCGAELLPTQAEVKTEALTCPKCGAENKAGSKFCHACSAALHKD